MNKTSQNLSYGELTTTERKNNLCERCIVTYGEENAFNATMKRVYPQNCLYRVLTNHKIV